MTLTARIGERQKRILRAIRDRGEFRPSTHSDKISVRALMDRGFIDLAGGQFYRVKMTERGRAFCEGVLIPNGEL